MIDVMGLVVSFGMVDVYVYIIDFGGGYCDEWEGYVIGMVVCVKGGVMIFMEMFLN